MATSQQPADATAGQPESQSATPLLHLTACLTITAISVLVTLALLWLT